ncbi:hypothetical protein LGQ02_01740 [Bacillus shivajii]|uniref:hypothetical protein n=1 Tax=Bacillus shivajii TaxID=1983719 RepID=UPI001CFAFCBD|nr:hypothetical protein [Bacillus shivajii]UCZ53545.1 hypothetical protein LGQ02_01740 [Bacillus shivajii]
MVITKDMPVSGIANSWPETIVVFEKYKIAPKTNQALKAFEKGEELKQLIKEINAAIGSSEVTCVEGG